MFFVYLQTHYFLVNILEQLRWTYFPSFGNISFSLMNLEKKHRDIYSTVLCDVSTTTQLVAQPVPIRTTLS